MTIIVLILSCELPTGNHHAQQLKNDKSQINAGLFFWALKNYTYFNFIHQTVSQKINLMSLSLIHWFFDIYGVQI